MVPCIRNRELQTWSRTFQSLSFKIQARCSDCFLCGHLCCPLGPSVPEHHFLVIHMCHLVDVLVRLGTNRSAGHTLAVRGFLQEVHCVSVTHWERSPMQESDWVSAGFKIGLTSRKCCLDSLLLPWSSHGTTTYRLICHCTSVSPLPKVKRQSQPLLKASVKTKNGDSGKRFRVVSGLWASKEYGQF